MEHTTEDKLPAIFIERLETSFVCEKQSADGSWIKVEITFDPIQETRIVRLPNTYKPTGQTPRAFFRRSSDQHEANLILHAVKGIRNFFSEVYPNFEEAAEILSEHGYPMEEAERLCV